MNVCKTEQCRCETNGICSNLVCTLALLTNHRNKHLLKSKLHLLPWFVLCWVFLLMLCPYCQSQLTHQSNQLTKNQVIQHTGMLQTYTQIKRTLLPKLLFRVKATSQGSMTIFLQLCQTCSIKLTSFPADFAALKFENTILSALHKCFVQPHWIQWFIWVLQRCNNLLCLYAAQHEGVQISLRQPNYNRLLHHARFPISTLVPAVSEYIDLTSSSNQLTFAHKTVF